ncbi:MAG: hypothetical protein QXG00_03090 [Candidatus Woesearchaeota archaeon]
MLYKLSSNLAILSYVFGSIFYGCNYGYKLDYNSLLIGFGVLLFTNVASGFYELYRLAKKKQKQNDTQNSNLEQKVQSRPFFYLLIKLY